MDNSTASAEPVATRTIVANKRFLNFPIDSKAPRKRVDMSVDGQSIGSFDVELAENSPEWWSAFDLGQWHGKTVTYTLRDVASDAKSIALISETDKPIGQENLYREALRPQFHFSAQRGWLNDPNGMIYANGQYHLFFQHSPFTFGDGAKFWGNAVSKDMVHWKELPAAIVPDSDGAIWSGSAVLDRDNVSDLGSDGKAPLVLMYTRAGNPFTQCIASGVDGVVFHKFAGNPVISNISADDRDPRAFWYEPKKCWVAVLWVPEGNVNTIQFFTSPDLKAWTHKSTFRGGVGNDRFLYECPDLFELPVDGNEANSKWVLTAADGQYAVGTFDGQTFTADATHLHGNVGRGFYAPQTFNDEPKGRRVQIGWMMTDTHGMPFNQSMSLPIELKLKSTADGPRMTWTPVKELEALRSKTHHFGGFELTPESANPAHEIKAELQEIRTDFVPQAGTTTRFHVRGVDIEYVTDSEELVINGHRTHAPLQNGRQDLAIFVDRTSVEVFASKGLIYVPMPINLSPTDVATKVSVSGGAIEFGHLDIHELKGIW